MTSIQESVISRLQQEEKRSVIDLDSVRAGHQAAHEYEGEVQPVEVLIAKGHDPLHAVYTYTQNFMSILIEQVAELPELTSWVELYERLEDEYMPSGPPMSPLTGSYFWCWTTFDLTFGENKETIGQCALAIARQFGTPDEVINTMEVMQNSRMGFYAHEGIEGDFVRLRNIVTDDLHLSHVSSGYQGSQGEIWYVRLFPPLLEALGYYVTFSTPYVIRNINEQGLKERLAQLMPEMVKRGYQSDYHELMKWGPAVRYWNEYLMLAYRDFSHNVVYLTGYPSEDAEASDHDVDDLN